MSSPKQAVSCRYHYDPLDRLTGTDQTGEANAQRFYQKTHLVTEIQGELQRTIFQHDDQLLAQHQKQGTDAAATLLATDQQRSVLHTLDGPDHKQVRYSAYGHRPAESGLNALLGFNGERRDPVTGCYMLGNGYRAFNPVLMRFNSPDSLSPFGEGGLNGYAYCQGDPVNFDDPTGHILRKNPFSFLAPVVETPFIPASVLIKKSTSYSALIPTVTPTSSVKNFPRPSSFINTKPSTSVAPSSKVQLKNKTDVSRIKARKDLGFKNIDILSGANHDRAAIHYSLRKNGFKLDSEVNLPHYAEKLRLFNEKIALHQKNLTYIKAHPEVRSIPSVHERSLKNVKAVRDAWLANVKKIRS